ncbi:D(1) dopamine receptor-like [Branchiostoma lanceolatum]|uniref:DRD1 protein n=1 Tax=Branchiostoma lanceolatum TaxID=7740 RepID=A0A8K0ELB4_BRALA|nr:DRD1 [Branchiostoma lanceolatum]
MAMVAVNNSTNSSDMFQGWEDLDGVDLLRVVGVGGILYLIVLVTILGNLMVLTAVMKYPHLRSKVTNYFICSLAVSDLMVGFLVLPWAAAQELLGYWPFGQFCSTFVSLDVMCCTASILNLCVISVDRFWAISDPFKYEREMTCCRAALMIGLAWCLSAMISLIPIGLGFHHIGETITVTQRQCESNMNEVYAITSSFISFYIPVIIMVLAYSKIMQIARRKYEDIVALHRSVSQNTKSVQESRTALRRETRIFKTLACILGVFIVCWLPFFILNCLVPFCPLRTGGKANFTCIDNTVFTVFEWLGWVNSTLNPIIYAFNNDFRKAFWRMLCRRVAYSRSDAAAVNCPCCPAETYEMAEYRTTNRAPRSV